MIIDSKSAVALAAALGIGFVGFGSAMGLGRSVAAAMDATARQPEAAGKIMVNMIIGCAFIEALTIYALLIAFNLAGKV